ncbi:MAG: sulfatase/phosphatase domain-containing protein, partial [Limisphaerales bacterium]
MGSQSGQRPGFDFSASYIGHGRYEDCPFEINGVSKPTSGWVDDVSTDFAIGFMRTNKSVPFSMVVGFKSPHDPRMPPARWKDAFAGESCRPAVNENARPPYKPFFGDNQQLNKKGPARANASEYRMQYFRCIAAADENLGRLLAALDELGIAENTMVIYSSDNGYYLGDHGLGDKRSAYEESLRIPMLLRYPKLGVKGVVVDEPVLNLDLAPTLIDFAGLQVPRQMQGSSWRPLLIRKGIGVVANWRTSFFYEYFYERNFAVPTIFAVRTEAGKLIQYPGHTDWTEAFNLKADPYEMNNLATNAAQKNFRAELESEFERQAKKVDFRIPDYADKPDDSVPQKKPAGRKAAKKNAAKVEP